MRKREKYIKLGNPILVFRNNSDFLFTTGPPKLPDMARLYILLNDGSFVKNLEFVNVGHADTRPLVFATTADRMSMVDRFASATKPSSVLCIDMTYKIGPFYVTQFVLPHPLFRWKDKNTHPTITVGIGVSYRKVEDDYTFFSDKLKTHLKIKTLVYGTDGEPALEKPMENNFPIEGKNYMRKHEIRQFFFLFHFGKRRKRRKMRSKT